MSTLGEALINPDCVTTSSSAAELFYMKQTGFAAMPFIAVFVAFIFWYAYGCVKKTPFFVKAPKRLSITSSARLAQMLHSKAHDAKKKASTTAAADTAAKATAASASSVIASVLASTPARSSRSKNANATQSSTSSSSTAPRGTKRRRLSAASRNLTTPKDKFVVSVTVVVYLIFPTLCKQTFQIFDCKTIAGIQYLAMDLEHPCYKGTHMAAVMTLGLGQLLLYVAGLPLLVLFFLCRNRRRKGGLHRRRVRVRYGLFFGAYKDETYFWEVVLTTRKIGVVAISVFGKSIGVQRQAQLALLILFICITVEIAGKPYKLVTKRHKVLGQLELASLFTLWGTMWCGTLIFASQSPGDHLFVVLLSVIVGVINVASIMLLVVRLVSEYAYENKDSKVGKILMRRMESIHHRHASFSAKGTALHGMEIDMTSTAEEDSATAAAAATALSSTARWRQVSSVGRVNALFKKGIRNEQNRETSARAKRRYSRFETGEGKNYFVPVSGDGETVWELPEGATLVEQEQRSEGIKKREGTLGPSSRAKLRYYSRFKTNEGKEYFVPVSGDGETVWELPKGAALVETTPQSGVHGQRTRQERKTSARTRRYSKFQTDEGKKYFVPVSGDGKAVWKLPEDATLVTL